MNTSIEQISSSLWQARVEGGSVAATPIDSEDQAYLIQAQLSDCAAASVVGYKIGATLPAALDLLQLDEPFFGPLFDSHCRASGAKVPLSAQHTNMLETEFVVGIGADIAPRQADYNREEIVDSIAWVSGGFEIVGTRFDTEFKGAGRHFIADSGANVDFVMGEKLEDWQSLNLSSHPATLSINNVEKATGHSGMSIWEHPLGPVAWLANHRVMAKRGLKAGDIITTGSCTGMTAVSAGDTAEADFGAIGKVAVEFVSI